MDRYRYDPSLSSEAYTIYGKTFVFFAVVHSTANLFLLIHGHVDWEYEYINMLPWIFLSNSGSIFLRSVAIYMVV